MHAFILSIYLSIDGASHFDSPPFCMDNSFNPIFSMMRNNQSVLIKVWINPQSNSFSVKQPTYYKGSHPKLDCPITKMRQARKKQREEDRKLPPSTVPVDVLIPVFQDAMHVSIILPSFIHELFGQFYSGWSRNCIETVFQSNQQDWNKLL